ncbi:2OG-Fe(II) oxygenase [Chitinimonas sp. PSY-7]|uniref:2OG-Fe(II) oxygenase n=1 Tax=Chitinimonas sp. PSY-7 TaxID=3459088 RepID=UPI004040109E
MPIGFRAGRQQTGYQTFTFLHVKWPAWLGGRLLGFDGHLILYPTGSHIPPHVDKVSDGCHYRINLVLWQPARGGKFECHDAQDRPCWSVGQRLFFFRPDQMTHSVSQCESRRVVLSLGWALRDMK